VPVLRALRRAYPEAHISWLLSTACAALMEGDSDLDEVIPFDRHRLGRAWRSPSAARLLAGFLKTLRRAKFDWVIDLQGLFRSGFFARVSGARLRAGFANAREGAWLFYTQRHRPDRPHTVDRNIGLAKQLGIDARREDMILQVPPAGREFAEAFRERHGREGGDFFVFVPPTRWPTKCYPVRHWRAVAEALAERMPVALLGAKGDRSLCAEIAAAGPGVIDLAGETTLPQMVGLIAGARCVVCSDSAAQHIAQAVGVDVVSLIGPTRPERTGPLIRGRALVAPVPCQGCLRRRCRHITCMQMIAPETVVAAVEEMLEEQA
jgi:ADP-heptose:LPS heptosyltransferase